MSTGTWCWENLPRRYFFGTSLTDPTYAINLSLIMTPASFTGGPSPGMRRSDVMKVIFGSVEVMVAAGLWMFNPMPQNDGIAAGGAMVFG